MSDHISFLGLKSGRAKMNILTKSEITAICIKHFNVFFKYLLYQCVSLCKHDLLLIHCSDMVGAVIPAWCCLTKGL